MRSFLILLALTAAPPATAQPRADLQARIEAVFAPWDAPASPGAAVAVVQDGQVVFAEGYGQANLEHDAPITPETVFYIGSVGKQITAFAVALLAAEGALSLDAPVQRYVPELPTYEAPITVRHLIHHTSGLRDYFALLALAGLRDDDPVTQQQVLDVIVAQQGLNFPPGTAHRYSNSGYALLATIVERISGQSFRAFMQERVFEPLGMTHSFVGDDYTEIVSHRADSYAGSQEAGFRKVVKPYAAYGAGGIYSTARNVARWLMHLDAPRVGGEAVIRQLHEPGVLTGGDTLDYAFALSQNLHRGVRFIGHSGALAGYRAYAGRAPSHGLGVVVLSNLASFDAPGTAMRVAEVFLADAMTPAPQRLPQGPEEERASFSLEPEDLAAYTGRYESRALGAVYSVEQQRGGLVVRHSRHGLIGLQPRETDVFSGDRWFFSSVTFERDAEGAMTGFRVSDGSRTDGVRFEKMP